jgi:mRNA interferase RelE/StbE
MEIVFSKDAVKFLEKLSAKDSEKIREKLSALLESIEIEGIVPFNELDIKNLKGEWKGFLRMRVGKIRIILKIDAESDTLQIYDIDFRGNIYKSLQIEAEKARSLILKP